MKKVTFILTIFLAVSCGKKEKIGYRREQKIEGNFLYTMVVRQDVGYLELKEYAYFNALEIDSLTNPKKEYLKAKKILNHYKKLNNEIHNINK